MNIDIELFRLIQKYGIFDITPRLKDIYMYEYFSVIINEIFDKIPSNDVIAIRGNGLHTAKIFEVLSEQNKKRISYLIDKDAGPIPEGRDISLLLPEEIEDNAIDVIILSTFKWRKMFMSALVSIVPKMTIIDPYDEMEKRRVFFQQDFYVYERKSKEHINYIDTIIENKKYLSVQSANEKKFHLERLIAYLIEIKDFYTAEKVIDTYINFGWDCTSNYAKFKEEMHLLFQNIMTELKTRDRRDIIINWIDCINAKEFYDSEFGAERQKDSCCFYNAFTPSPWTYSTTMAMFTGKLPITDHTYKKSFISESNSKVLLALKENGYKFKYIAYPGTYQKWFKNQSDIIEMPEGFREESSERAATECSTRMQWYSLKDRVQQTEGNVCHLIHNLGESHAPYHYSLAETLKSNGDKRSAGIEFIFKQIEWYRQFLPEDAIEIYLSDHGNGGARPYDKELTNIALVVRGRSIPAKGEYKLYSHQNFSALLFAIIHEDYEWGDTFSDYIIQENVDFLVRNTLIEWVLSGIKNKKTNMKLFQCRAIRTLNDVFVKYANGKELYFKVPNEKTNLIGDPSCKERIIQMRDLCGDYFIDITKNKYFKDSEILYYCINAVPSEWTRW